jgi:hypothetical protein
LRSKNQRDCRRRNSCASSAGELPASSALDRLSTTRAVCVRLQSAHRPEAGIRESAFDAFLPPDLRVASDDFWTPLAVVAEAARWLEELGAQRVVDVGAGPGTSAPLRHRLRHELNAPVPDVWALVGRHERLHEYSAGMARPVRLLQVRRQCAHDDGRDARMIEGVVLNHHVRMGVAGSRTSRVIGLYPEHVTAVNPG